MAVSTDIFQIVHTSQQDGVEVDNVYFYQRETAITAGAQALAEEWQEQVLPAIQVCRSDDVVTNQIHVQNLFDAADVWDVFLSEAGDLGNIDVLPPHDAVTFTLVRETAQTRNGSKRMACIPEAAQVDGVILQSEFLDALADIADVLVDEILGTLDVPWFFPVIVKRLLSVGIYSLPTTQSEAIANPIVDSGFNPDVSTQTSRKYGNGA